MRWGGGDGKGATVISNVAVCNSRIEGYELTKFFHAWWNDPRRTSRFIFLDREEWRGSFDDWKGKKKVFQVPPGWNKNVLKTVTLRFPKQKIFRAKELLHFHGWRANCDSIKRAPFPVEFQRNHALKKVPKKKKRKKMESLRRVRKLNEDVVTLHVATIIWRGNRSITVPRRSIFKEASRGLASTCLSSAVDRERRSR